MAGGSLLAKVLLVHRAIHFSHRAVRTVLSLAYIVVVLSSKEMGPSPEIHLVWEKFRLKCNFDLQIRRILIIRIHFNLNITWICIFFFLFFNQYIPFLLTMQSTLVFSFCCTHRSLCNICDSVLGCLWLTVLGKMLLHSVSVVTNFTPETKVLPKEESIVPWHAGSVLLAPFFSEL